MVAVASAGGRLARLAVVAAAAGLSWGVPTGPAAAWQIEYRAPDLGLREIYASGAYKTVSRVRKRTETWCIYDRTGRLLRRTRTFDSFFIIERTSFDAPGRPHDNVGSYRATVYLPDGSIWPLVPGKSIRFIISIADGGGRTVQIRGRLSVVGRRAIRVGDTDVAAVIVRRTATQWFETAVTDASTTDYAYFPAHRNAIVIRDVRQPTEKPVRVPSLVRIQQPRPGKAGRFPRTDCGPLRA
jgi:hypothetical protein